MKRQHEWNSLRAGIALACFLMPVAHAQDGLLQWNTGDSLKGRLLSVGDHSLTWESSLFADPLEIELEALSGIQFTPSAEKTKDGGRFRVQLRNGDVLFASLIGISESSFTLQGDRFGTAEVPRDQIVMMQQDQPSNGLIFSGPHGIEGWQPAFRRTLNDEENELTLIRMRQEAGEKTSPQQISEARWKELPDGSLVTSRPDTAIFLPLELPDQFEVEMDLRFTGTPSFLMSIGRDAKEGLRLQSWVDFLVAANGDKFTGLRELTADDRSLHLHLFVNYPGRTMSVFQNTGEKLGEITTEGLRGGPKGILFRNGDQTMTIRSLRINSWDGREPKIVTGAGARIELADGSVHFGNPEQLKTDSGVITLRTADQQFETRLDQVTAMFFPSSDERPVPRGDVIVSWPDGASVSGHQAHAENNILTLSTSWTSSQLKCPLGQAKRLVLPGKQSDGNTASSQSDRLFHAEGSLQGILTVVGADKAPIRWTPAGGLNSTALRNSNNGRIVRGRGISHFSQQPDLQKNYPDVVYLANDDVVPCRISSWSESGLTLVSPMTDRTIFPNDELRAVEMAASVRTHQQDFSDNHWKGNAARNKERTTVVFRGTAGYSNQGILTGDVVRFHMKWPKQGYAHLTVALFGDQRQIRDQRNVVTFSLMQSMVQISDRPAQQNQVFWGHIGNANVDEMVHAPECEVDVELRLLQGKILVAVDGELKKTIPLKTTTPETSALRFHANVMSTGAVVVNGRVQEEDSSNGLELSQFEVDNISGGSVRQFIQEETRQALLTIPRFRRNTPPSHVLIAPNGDVLRGRLVSVTEDEIQFESRLETLRLDRTRVAAIVWLQLRDPKDQATSEAGDGFVMNDEQPDSDGTVVHANLADGYRVTLAAERLQDGQIEGRSDLLGRCRFPAASIRELHLGQADAADVSISFERWIAEHAREPDWDVPESDGGSAEAHEMMGTQAPDFELPLLDGSRFRLSEHRDKIIVLDFWATWCGPCVAALPDYVSATSRFDTSKVLFVAVNQQEASDQIRAFLAESRLNPTVALDREGIVGQQFHVSGIPHTVILGPQNTVEDVHVGYSPGSGEQMQVTIQQLLDGTWKRPSPSNRQEESVSPEQNGAPGNAEPASNEQQPSDPPN